MDIDWEVFGKSLEQVANLLASNWMKDYEREKELTYLQRAEQIRSDIAVEEHKRDLAEESANRIKTETELNKMELASRLQQVGLEAQFDAFNKSPDMIRNYANALMSDDPRAKMQVAAQLGVINKAKSGHPLSQEDYAALDTLDPVSKNAAMSILRENEERRTQLDVSKANIGYMNALQGATSQRGGLTIDDLPRLMQLMSSASDSMANLSKNPVYLHGQSVLTQILLKNPDPIQARAEFEKAMGTELPEYLAIQNALHMHQQTVSMTEQVIQNLFPQPTGTAEEVEQPAPEVPQGTPVTTQKPNALAEKVMAAVSKKGKEVVSGAGKGLAELVSGKSSKIKKILKKVGLPANTHVIVAKSPEEVIMNLKSGKYKGGEYIFVNGELVKTGFDIDSQTGEKLPRIAVIGKL